MTLQPFVNATGTTRRARSELDVSDVAELASAHLGTPIFGLVQTPRAVSFLILGSDGDVLGAGGKKFADLAEAFELRFFSAKGELAWRRAGEKGRAVLTVDDAAGKPQGFEDLQKPELKRSTKRLLWGKVDGAPSANGWLQLSSPRIGSISVPPLINANAKPASGRAVVKVVEYARIAEDGNVIAAGERLAGFAWAKEPAQEGNP
jgi:CRISPR-associated protein (TIGR03984 family)